MKRLLIFLILLFPAIGHGFPSLAPDFIEYIKSCENGIRKGWSGSKWFPYHDGTAWHIAHGHLIKKGEDFDQGITDEQARELLLADLDEAYKAARTFFARKGIDIQTFSGKKLEMIIDFAFNGCLRSHPKMLTAIISGNIREQIKEYKRYAVIKGQRVEIKDRNTRFRSRYLNTKSS